MLFNPFLNGVVMISALHAPHTGFVDTDMRHVISALWCYVVLIKRLSSDSSKMAYTISEGTAW